MIYFSYKKLGCESMYLEERDFRSISKRCEELIQNKSPFISILIDIDNYHETSKIENNERIKLIKDFLIKIYLLIWNI